MILVLILTFPRDITGATFFRQYNNRNHTLHCSQQATEYVWYGGSNGSLHEFAQINSKHGTTSSPQCVGDPQSIYREKTFNLTAYPAGGIFACAPVTEKGTCPLFSNSTHCSNFDFFVVAILNRTAEKNTFDDIPGPSEANQTVREKDNFTLACEFTMQPENLEFTLYWIKDTCPSTCLSSVSRKGYNFSYDLSCCVDATLKERVNHPMDRHVTVNGSARHSLTIFNATSNDSGRYLCVVTAWDRKHVWKIAYNVTIGVGEPTSSYNRSTYELQIALAVTGVIILIFGIVWLVYRKKKSKGNPVEQLPRNQSAIEMEGDDCSPYAVSSRNDMERIETLYSVITDVPKPPEGSSALPDDKPISASGEKVQPIYSVVSKKRNEVFRIPDNFSS